MPQRCLLLAHTFWVWNMAQLRRQEERSAAQVESWFRLMLLYNAFRDWDNSEFKTVSLHQFRQTEIWWYFWRLGGRIASVFNISHAYVSCVWWAMFHTFSFVSRRLAQWVCASACTDWNAPVLSNPTIPRQPDTTGRLPSHVIYITRFHSFQKTLGRVERDSWCFHRTTAWVLDTSKRIIKADSLRQVTEFEKHGKFASHEHSYCLSESPQYYRWRAA